MLEIDNNNFLNFKNRDGVTLKKGNIVQLYVENNEVFFDKSDGIAPIGIVVGTNLSGFTNVEYRRKVYITDQYEPDTILVINANLYVSKRGLLTTTRENKNNPCVGMVIKKINEVMFQFIWM